MGFPGETDEEFQGLISFLKQAQLDWVGFFTYSREEDTPAGRFSGQIPESVKLERYQEAVSVQEQIIRAKNKEFIGKTISVMIDRIAEDRPGYYIGRGERSAPEVDGVTFIKANHLTVGSIVKVIISGVEDLDLIGECVD